MVTRLDEDAVVGRWLHAFEEDEPGRRVFRPDSWAFPPARRPRSGLDLEPDGTAVEREPGPGDRRDARSGRWRLDKQGRLRLRIGDLPEKVLEIEAAGDGRLVVKA